MVISEQEVFMRIARSVVVWGEVEVPEGYIPLAMIILEPGNVDMWFTVAAPGAWLESASQLDRARLVGETVLRELVMAARKTK
jgi:hypothetical protein